MAKKTQSKNQSITEIDEKSNHNMLVEGISKEKSNYSSLDGGTAKELEAKESGVLELEKQIETIEKEELGKLNDVPKNQEPRVITEHQQDENRGLEKEVKRTPVNVSVTVCETANEEKIDAPATWFLVRKNGKQTPLSEQPSSSR
ncbi:hypothetical protein ACFE04_003160 [Oxalis oulophora]